jgi:hypothetical protein
MKIRVTLELELPDLIDKDGNLQDEYVKGITKEMAHVTQDVFENFINYATCRHIEDAVEELTNPEKRTSPYSKLIVDDHNKWSDILQKAEPSLKIEKIG